MFVGGMAGGVIVDYLGSKAGKALFSSCLESVVLNENNGRTGGVEVWMITSLNPLKSDFFFLLSQINFITFHLNSDIPNILVIHPYYRNTLTGYILGLLDFFLKGYQERNL